MSQKKYTPRARELRPMKEGTFIWAIREAIREEMARDENVFVLGLDVEVGPYGATRGLVEDFGKERIRNCPMSEASMTGMAVGASLMGLRPIVEIMYGDFVTLAMDQIVNSAAKMRFMSAGKQSLPMVVRVPFGATGGAMHHAQSFESWFMHVPGIHLVYPSTPYDAKGLLKTCIRHDDPVVFAEHRRLYPMPTSADFPEAEYTVPLGKADVKRKGDDITVVATALQVHKALAADDELEKDGVSLEVVDPRTLQPLDKETIIDSVKKTGRVIVAHEACKVGGVGAEIAATIAEEAIEYLDAPIKRLGAPHTPIPAHRSLEKYWLSFSSEEAIIKTAKELMAY